MAEVQKFADISSCGLYRYSLRRIWCEGPPLIVVMLNPSTADARVDDPTIRRVMGFAQSNGYGGIIVLNLFAWRATSPAALKAADYPVGPLNMEYWQETHETARNHYPYKERVHYLCAWGAGGGLMNQDKTFMEWLQSRKYREIYCLGTTKAGFPKHPLYLPKDTPMEPYYGR